MKAKTVLLTPSPALSAALRAMDAHPENVLGGSAPVQPGALSRLRAEQEQLRKKYPQSSS